MPKVTILPDPAPIKTYPIEFSTAVVDGATWLTLDGKSYENLSKTMADIVRWVGEARWRLDWYRKELSETHRDEVEVSP